MWCGMVLPECVLYYVTMVLSPVWLKPSRGGYSGNRKMRSSLSASRSRDQQGIRSGDKENGPSPWRSNSSRAPVIPILIWQELFDDWHLRSKHRVERKPPNRRSRPHLTEGENHCGIFLSCATQPQRATRGTGIANLH